MEENFRRYPIGIQNFEQLRNRDCIYVLYMADGKRIIKVGVNFDSAMRTIGGWMVD